jgi:hypothetical protein
VLKEWEKLLTNLRKMKCFALAAETSQIDILQAIHLKDFTGGLPELPLDGGLPYSYCRETSHWSLLQ